MEIGDGCVDWGWGGGAGGSEGCPDIEEEVAVFHARLACPQRFGVGGIPDHFKTAELFA